MQKILVPVDFSTGSEQLIKKALKMANAFSSIIYFIHVEPPIKDSSGRDNGDPISEMSNDYPDEMQQLNALAQRVRDTGIETHALFSEGVPSLSILDVATKMQVELIIMGTHGYGVLADFFLGGVSQAVIKKSTCPILLVPTRGE